MRPKLIPFALLAAVCPVLLNAYTPPYGIINPNTTFGWEIDRPTPAWPSQWTQATPADAPNCYYVDKTAGNATDTNNPLGNPGKPRVHIPEGYLAAGTFIYVNAGTYTPADSAGDRFDWTGVGTSANPIWITGNATTRPILQDHCQIGGTIGAGNNTSYVVFENFEISDQATPTYSPTLDICPATDGNTIDHILIRNVKRVGTQNLHDLNGITIGLSAPTDIIPNSTISNVVMYKCDMSYMGDPTPTGSDTCGYYNGFHTSYVWVLNCVVHNVGADGIAGSHYANTTTRKTEHYYIGGNLSYQNGENGIDLKADADIVISQNEIYGPFTREQGWAIILHYGASPPVQDRGAFVFFNRIHHVSGAVYTGTTAGCDNLNVFGNLIYDVHASYVLDHTNGDDALNGYCFEVGGSHGTIRFANNTCYDTDGGVYIHDTLTTGDMVKIHGNIFANVTHTVNPKDGSPGFELKATSGMEPFVSSDYNLYSPNPSFFWANGGTRTFTYMQGTAGIEAHSNLGDPAFTNVTIPLAENPTPSAGQVPDFHLTNTSPAIDASVEGPVGDSIYAAFQTQFGVNLRKDFDGNARPVDTYWDLGALESALAPLAPSNLSVHP